MAIMLCFLELCVCSHACMCALMTGCKCASTLTCSSTVCASVWVHCVYIREVLCVCSGLLMKNVLYTDVAFGTGHILEQDV